MAGHQTKKKSKTEKDRKRAELAAEEAARQKGEPLPKREVMSTVTPGGGVPGLPVDDLDGMYPIDPIPKDLRTGGA